MVANIYPVLAHHPYDYIVGFGIAFVGMGLITWAERRARGRHRSSKPETRPEEGS